MSIKPPTNIALLSATIKGHLMANIDKNDYKQVLQRTEEIEWMTRSELFEQYLNAIGIFGFGDQILNAIYEIDQATTK